MRSYKRVRGYTQSLGGNTRLKAKPRQEERLKVEPRMGKGMVKKSWSERGSKAASRVEVALSFLTKLFHNII